ncbi:hypothetical protein BC831DRAFT_92504 [Entophlyctis helioformis]|nr:hypothetical protein BC831DRAFT_92504 [Entophlyctis helioformis]
MACRRWALTYCAEQPAACCRGRACERRRGSTSRRQSDHDSRLAVNPHSFMARLTFKAAAFGSRAFSSARQAGLTGLAGVAGVSPAAARPQSWTRGPSCASTAASLGLGARADMFTAEAGSTGTSTSTASSISSSSNGSIAAVPSSTAATTTHWTDVLWRRWIDDS